MPNIFDFLNWRGDLSLSCLPLCDVDYLVFCRLAYMPFENIVGSFDEKAVQLNDAAEYILSDNEKIKKFPMENDITLLKSIAASERYKYINVYGYVNSFSALSEKQFSATSFVLPDSTVLVSFRGTDGSLVGWKENLNMAFSEQVPAQREAVEYLAKSASYYSFPLRVCGHSKGGNLALYSSAFCPYEVQSRIIEARNLDGPGFSKNIISSEEFSNILDRTKTYLPQSSVIGMLLEHCEDFIVVCSTSLGLGQHDLYTWEVMRNGFIELNSLTNSSKFIDETIDEWLSGLNNYKREKLVDGIYAILKASKGQTLDDVLKGKNTLNILKSLRRLERETREVMSEAFILLKKSIEKNLHASLESIQATSLVIL